MPKPYFVAGPINSTNAKDDAAFIRKTLKLHDVFRKLRVHLGRGTSSQHIYIKGSGPHGEFTGDELSYLKDMGISPGGNLAIILPERRAFWLKQIQYYRNGFISGRVGQLHVSASDRKVIFAIRSAVYRPHQKSLEWREDRKAAYREGIRVHRANQALFLSVQRGRF